MASDLTFDQLSDALPADSVLALAAGAAVANAGVYLNVSAITGDAITALADDGVIETLLKLIQAGSKAQTTINATAAAGSRLNAFPATTYGAPILDDATGNYFSTVSGTVIGRAPLSIDSLVGPQI